MATFWKAFDAKGNHILTVATNSLADAVDMAQSYWPERVGNHVAGVQFWKEGK